MESSYGVVADFMPSAEGGIKVEYVWIALIPSSTVGSILDDVVRYCTRWPNVS